MHERILKRQNWLIVAGFFFLSGLLAATWNARIPDVQDSTGLNNAAWGMVLVALPAGLVTGLFLSGWLVARFGATMISIITCLLASVLLAALGFAGERLLLMILLFFTGFNRAIMNIAINTRAVELQKDYERPIVSTFHGIWSLACLVAVGVGTVMIMMEVKYAIHFSIIAMICFTATLLNHKKNQPQKKAFEKKPFFIRPDRYLLLLGSIAFFGMAAENTMFDWSINYFDKVVLVDKSWRTAGYICFIVTMSAGRMAGDRLIHRYGAVNMLLFNGLMMATGFAVAALMPQVFAVCIGFLLIGFGDSSIVPIVYALAGKAKLPMAYAITSVTTIGYMGFLVNPPIVGLISEAKGMQWAFGLMAIFSLVICLLSLKVRDHFKL